MLWFLYIRYFLDFICLYILFDRWENVEKKENLVLLENVFYNVAILLHQNCSS